MSATRESSVESRFQTWALDDPRLAGQPYDRIGDEYGWCIVEVAPNGKPIRVLGDDIAEPEDKLLVRDFSWVADVLNLVRAEVIEQSAAIADRWIAKSHLDDLSGGFVSRNIRDEISALALAAKEK